MDHFYIFVAVVSALVLVVGGWAERIKPYVGPPLLLVVAGVALDTVIDPPGKAVLHHLELVTWLAVGFGVTSIALRFDRTTFSALWRVGAMVTVVAMAGMWAASAALVWALAGVPVLAAVLVGAIVTPTDPVVASSIVTGPFAKRHLPERLRLGLSLESGANDGLAFLFVFLPLLVLQHGVDAGVTEWVRGTLLWSIGVAGLLGATIGGLIGFAIRRLSRSSEVNSRAMMLASIATTVAVVSALKALSMDSIWGVFVGAMVLAMMLRPAQREAADSFQEGEIYLVLTPALVLFGMALPWEAWRELGWTALTLPVLVLLFRRLPVVWLLYGGLKNRTLRASSGSAAAGPGPVFQGARDAWFYGWFGPIGVSTIFYATTAHRLLDDPLYWHLASLCVFASVIAHGLSAGALSRVYRTAASKHADAG